MHMKLALSAIALGLLCGNVQAQTTNRASDPPGATSERRPTPSTRNRIRSTMPSIKPADGDDEGSISPLMPSRTLGDEPYSSIEPKGTWIGSMGIFNRALLDKRGSRTRKAGISTSRSHKTRL